MHVINVWILVVAAVLITEKATCYPFGDSATPIIREGSWWKSPSHDGNYQSNEDPSEEIRRLTSSRIDPERVRGIMHNSFDAAGRILGNYNGDEGGPHSSTSATDSLDVGHILGNTFSRIGKRKAPISARPEDETISDPNQLSSRGLLDIPSVDLHHSRRGFPVAPIGDLPMIGSGYPRHGGRSLPASSSGYPILTGRGPPHLGLTDSLSMFPQVSSLMGGSPDGRVSPSIAGII